MTPNHGEPHLPAIDAPSVDLHPMHQFSTSGIAQAARRRVLQASDAALGQKLGSAVVTQAKRMYHMFVKKEGFQSSVQIAETLYT